MANEIHFEFVEDILAKGQELVEKVCEQNQQWPGAGAFDKDVKIAKAMIREIEHALAELIAELYQHIKDFPGKDIKSETRQAINIAYKLTSHLYDDVSDLHAALLQGKSQSAGIEMTRIHFQKLDYHYINTKDRILDAKSRLGSTKISDR